MKKPNWQYFSLEEYQQRLDALRNRMERLGVDAVLINTPENLYYLSGYQTPGYYWWQTLVVPMDREPVSVTRRVEDSNMRELGWVEDRRPYEDYEDWVEKTRGRAGGPGSRGKDNRDGAGELLPSGQGLLETAGTNARLKVRRQHGTGGGRSADQVCAGDRIHAPGC